MATKPELGITNPYALDDTQFQAAVDLLKAAAPSISKYWGTAQKQIDAFTNGDMAIGTTWQYQANAARGRRRAGQGVKPKEGTTGWSDTWMISSKAKHPNCMYKWMDYIISPEANAQVDGLLRRGAGRARRLRRGREAIAGSLRPLPRQRRGLLRATSATGTRRRRTASTAAATSCKDFDDWIKAWTEIKG